MAEERAKLEQLRRWRQTAVWAPVLWFPGVVYGLLVGEVGLALTLGFAGLVFAVVARGVVWLGRCPRCDAAFKDSPAAFRRIWDESSCQACDVSLFELRRGGGQASPAGSNRPGSKSRREDGGG